MSVSPSVFPKVHGYRVWSVSMFLFCGASLCSSRQHLLSAPGNWLEALDFIALKIIIQSCLHSSDLFDRQRFYNPGF